jgi:hypothetical protein
MDNVETENDGFFKYIFDLNESNKSNLMNMIQYAVLAFIPIILVLKVTKTYVPEANEEKGSLELLAESLFQVIFILLSFWFINRVITYIPTYSKKAYKEFNETTFIVGFVFILLTLQTKLGEKISILSDRVIEIWSGDASIREETVTKVKVTQPLSGGHQPSQADRLGGYGSMSPQMQPPMAQQIPHTPMMTNNKSQTNNYSIPSRQPVPDFSTMHSTETNPLVGAAQPGIMEPMAANEAIGSFGGSAW